MKQTISTFTLILFIIINVHAQKIQPEQYFPIFEDNFNDNRNVWVSAGQTYQDYSQVENGAYHLECFLIEDGCTQWWPHFDLEANKDFSISFELQWLNPSE